MFVVVFSDKRIRPQKTRHLPIVFMAINPRPGQEHGISKYLLKE